MIILLQSFETGLYLDRVGAWTEKPGLARTFPNAVQATAFKIHRRLSHAFVVVLPDTPPQPGPVVPRQEAALRVS